MLTILMMIEDEADRSFVASIYEKYALKMKAIAFDILKNEYDAEDCVHESVITIVKKLDAFKNTKDENHLKWLVLLVCKNTALNMYKKNMRRQGKMAFLSANDADVDALNDIADESPTPDESAAEEDNVKYMLSLINRLDEKYKNVLLLKYSGFSNKEISSVLFISEDTVRQRLFRTKNLILKMGGGRFHD